MAEAKHKRQPGELRDAWLVTDAPALNKMMPYIMPNRADNEAYINLDIDLRPLDVYLAKLNANCTPDNKYTYFHLVCAAIGKVFILRPRMNRFIRNNRLYQRKKVDLGFVVKKKFEDQSEEGLAMLDYTPETTLQDFHDHLMRIIHRTRSEAKKDSATDIMDTLCKLPHLIQKIIVNTVLLLDRLGIAPASLTEGDPNHAAIFLSNLGSIGLQCGYHHLVNWGTNSCFIIVGKTHRVMTYDENGNGDLHMVLPLGITLDERIADGYYYAKTVKLLEYLLSHPEELEKPANTPVVF